LLDIPQNAEFSEIKELIYEAEEEKKEYNWDKSIESLLKAEQLCSTKELRNIEGGVCIECGEIFRIKADFEKSEKDILESFQNSICYFQKALDIYKDMKMEEKTEYISGIIDYLKYISGNKEENKEILLERARAYFKSAKVINQGKGNLTESIKMQILETKTLSSIIGEKLIRIDESADLIALTSEYMNLLEDIWGTIRSKENISEIYLFSFISSIVEFSNFITHFLPSEKIFLKQYLTDILIKFEELIELLKDSKKDLIFFYAIAFYSWTHAAFSTYYAKNIFEQKKYLKKVQKTLEKGVPLLSKIKAHLPLVLFYYTRYTSAIFLISLGFSAKDFKFISDDLNRCIASSSILYPKTLGAHNILYSAGVFLVGALNQTSPESHRMDLTQKIQGLLQLAKNKTPIVIDPNYKTYNLLYNCELCLISAILGELSKDNIEKIKYFQTASQFFNRLAEEDNPKIYNTYFYHQGYVFCLTRAGIILAKNTTNELDKIHYYKNVVDFLLKSKEMILALFHIENLFSIGNCYFELGILTNDESLFKHSYLSYIDAIEYCKNKGYFNLVGSGYINLAKIDDRLNNFLSAAENYRKAIDSFDKAILTLTYTKLVQDIEILKNYLKAWNLIEIAKSHRANEDHFNAKVNYEEASKILSSTDEYNYEAPFYSAWAVLEEAEHLSKNSNHLEATQTYLTAAKKFESAVDVFNSNLLKEKSIEKIETISRLIKVAKIREKYCIARYNLETARIESKRENHLQAAELYSKAGSLFEYLCEKFRIKRDKDELSAIFYLCKAWENMEKADVEQKSTLYEVASNLFEKAGNIFSDKRMRKLSLGNSLYCSAIQYSSLFDKTTDLKEKINLYKKIKMFLRESAKNYNLGGFEHDAQWVLATSSFFDGIWYLILADNEIDHSKKENYLQFALNYLNNSLDIFGKAGYKEKREEILKYLKMIRDEKAILTSVLTLIEKPEIASSSVGISAPACPLEISSSVNLGIMQVHDKQAESEVNWFDRIHHIYLFMPNGTLLYDYSFKAEKDISPGLVTGGLIGLFALIKEVTESDTKLKIIEQEEMTILLEHGKYISSALITEENLVTLRSKLSNLIDELEDFYDEELKNFSGNLSVFSKIDKFIKRIFGH